MTRSVGYAVQVQPAEDAIGGPRPPADAGPPHGSESRISEAPSPDDTAASINS